MIVDCAHYRDGRRQHAGPMSLEQAAAHSTRGGFVWLGLFEPTPEELATVRASFRLHELAVEDAQAAHLRPKAERYEDGTELIVLRTARYDDGREEIDTGEISVFLSEHFVITVRQGVASELAGARSRLERRPELLRAGSAATLWAILDQVVDGYSPVVAELERDIEQIEATVFSGTVAPTERIYFLRREATDFYRAVHPLLAVLGRRLSADDSPGELLPYFRDVHDHLLLVNEEVAAQRDLLATVLEANIAVISVEQNKINLRQSATMERLTIVATVFLPLSFVVGFFGQNFGWLVGHITGLTAFLVLSAIGLLLPCLVLYLWLRRQRGREAPPTPGAEDGPGQGPLRRPARADSRREAGATDRTSHRTPANRHRTG
ncbi:magnesium and cobalt transport protein CorA [Kitasatospora sp. NPDC006697]|uniref:magnesium and cobalt transport protein CorA n=1 Tax=Kitasatospora sp. NPDC006697 TaxID=3364020 RepID=UPI0036BCB834